MEELDMCTFEYQAFLNVDKTSCNFKCQLLAQSCQQRIPECFNFTASKIFGSLPINAEAKQEEAWVRIWYALEEPPTSSFFAETCRGPVLGGFSRRNLSASSHCIFFREPFPLRRNGRLDGNTCELKLSFQGSLTPLMLSEKLHLTLCSVCFETYGNLLQEKKLILHHAFQ